MTCATHRCTDVAHERHFRESKTFGVGSTLLTTHWHFSVQVPRAVHITPTLLQPKLLRSHQTTALKALTLYVLHITWSRTKGVCPYIYIDCVTIIMVSSNHTVFATDVPSALACNTEKDKQTRPNFRTTGWTQLPHIC